LKEVGNTTHASLIVSFQYRVKYCSVEKVLGMAGAVSAIFRQLGRISGNLVVKNMGNFGSLQAFTR
jgi:hypothetical protein